MRKLKPKEVRWLPKDAQLRTTFIPDLHSRLHPYPYPYPDGMLKTKMPSLTVHGPSVEQITSENTGDTISIDEMNVFSTPLPVSKNGTVHTMKSQG